MRSVKVRRLERTRVLVMATNSGESGSRRQKRSWRRPRHAAGYPDSSSAASGSDISASPSGKETSQQPLGPLGPESTTEKQGGVQDDQSTPRNGGEGAIVEIDGSMMEGGGQILRNAVALGCLMGRPIRVRNIRAGRSKPGLRPQHLAGLHLIGQLCGGKLTGDSVNSTTVELCPGSIQNGNYSADTQTAGSTSLLLQVSLPCLLFATPTSSSVLTLRGGTDADMAPSIDYIIKIFKPMAAKFGVNFECEIKKRGFYPRGGGEVIVKPHPLQHITPATITEPGHVVSVSIHSFTAGTVPQKISHQMAQSARQQMEKQLPGVAVSVHEIHETRDTAYGNGSGIIVVAETSTGCLLGGSAIGKKEVPPYKCGRAAADVVLKAVDEGTCVDEHMQDQLIILMALAKGRSAVRTGPLTLHTKTAIHIARTLTPAVFNVRKLEGGAHLIECDGMGLENTS